MTLAAEHRAPYLGPQGAWTRGNATVSALLAATSAGGLALAWLGASDETRMDDVVPWLVLAVAAFAVGGLAGATWLGRGLRSIRTERVALRRRLLAMDLGRTDAAGVQNVWVIAAGMTRVHRPDCEYVRGKTVRPVAADDTAPACAVCTEELR